MKKNFFEGKSYGGGQFKGLTPEYYPPKYKKYIQEEVALLKSKVKGPNRILEAGVGIGRLIPSLAPLVKEFVGVDNSEFMLKTSKNVAGDFSNVKILNEKIEDLGSIFPQGHFDYSLCVWNTLGNVRDSIIVLKELSKITKKSIFITTFYKGTINDRLEFYKAVDVKVDKFDKENETFYLEGYTSKTFNEKDMQELAEKAGLIIKETRVLGEVILWAELAKK